MRQLLAVIIESDKNPTFVNGVKNGTTKYCAQCFAAEFAPQKNPLRIYTPEYELRRQAYIESEPEAIRQAGYNVETVYSDEYDDTMPEDNRGCDLTFGKVCDICHGTLASWHVCAFCGGVDWLDSSHECDAFRDAAHADKRTRAYKLYERVLNGFDTGFVDEFTEDQL